MKNKMFVFVISVIIGSCSGRSNEKVVEAPIPDEPVKASAPDVKSVIKTIAGKCFVPTDPSKSNFIFTINQNLTLRLVNYNGRYEGKAVDGTVQFNDAAATKIGFSMQDSLLLLKNENDVTIQFREAQDRDLIIGQWRKSTGAFESFAGDGTYQSTYAGTGRYERSGNNKFTASGLSYGITCQFRLDSPDQLSASSSFNSNDNWTSTKVKGRKPESLNILFD